MSELLTGAFARLIASDRAIRDSPNVIDARSFFNQRADDIRNTRIQRKTDD